jgi:hypothetical protein
MDSKIKTLVLTTLSTITPSVTFLKYDGEDACYITFFEYLNQGEGWAEDNEDQTGHYIQCDIWYTEDIGTLAEDMMNLFVAKDFTKKEIRDIGFDNETKRYHSIVSVFYLEQK